MRFLCSLVVLPFLAQQLSAAPVDPANFSESTYVSSTELGFITGMAWAPDGSGRLFVTRKGGYDGQQNAQVRIVQNGAVLPGAFATESVLTDVECGLLGLVFDPDFVNNGYVYFFATVSATEQQIIRYTAVGNTGTNRTVIVSGLPTIGFTHNGGAVGIGNDGHLYWGVGELGNSTGVDFDLDSLGAKIGRANRFTGAAPNDNPFFGQGNANTDKIWSRGYRNPFTFNFHATTGRLWVNTVGSSWEQVFVADRGTHAGFNMFENNQPAGFLTPVIAYRTNTTESHNIAANGAVRSSNLVTFTTTTPHPFRKGALATVSGLPGFNGTFPVASVVNANQFTIAQAGPNQTSGGGAVETQEIGGAVTGGCFYESTAFPAAYRGNYFFGDYNSGRIMRVPLDVANQPASVEQFVIEHAHHVDMATGPDGALYYAGQDSPGLIKRLASTSAAQNVIVYPTAFNVVEGGSSVVSVRLNSAPASNVNVSVARLSGDTNLSISSGASLTFTPANFATPQLVTIAAAQDSDKTNDSAVFRVNAPGVATHDLTVNGIDNDEPQLVLSTTSLAMNEGGSNSFTVRLASMPSANVSVSVAWSSGDSNVSVTAGNALTFTPMDYATPKTVTISAAHDDDTANDDATITVSSPNEISRNVAITVTDDDPLAPAFTSSPIQTAVDDAPYRYDANATGNPAPAFSLIVAPATMVIDSETGVIHWTPANTGSANVTVRATNSASSVDQSFQITVNADAPPTAVLTRPLEGEVLSGNGAEFFGNGIDDVSTVQAEFFIDDVLRDVDTNNSNHFHFGGTHAQFDTTLYANGPHLLRMRVTDTKGQTADREVQVSFGNGGDKWRQQHFNLNDPNELAQSAFTADPNGDGEVNLFEYFSDSNPKIADLSRAPAVDFVTVGDEEYLTLRFVRAKWVKDVTPRVETTGDLTSGPWNQIDPANPAYFVGVEANVPAWGLETVTVRDSIPVGADPRFMRLRLTKP